MRTLALFAVLSAFAASISAQESLTDKSFLGVWKTLDIDGSKPSDRAIIVLPDRLIDVTGVKSIDLIKKDLDSYTTRFVAVDVRSGVLQCVLKYHDGSNVQRGRLTIRQLKDGKTEIRYTLQFPNNGRSISRYLVRRYEPESLPASLIAFEKEQREQQPKIDKKDGS